MRSLADKILDPGAAGDWVRRRREAGQRVVWTNGCFDLLHRGHVHSLVAARSLGDALIVGLNDDASVGRLKGPSRPVVPLAARLEVIAGLEAVDAVTWFADDTPLNILLQLQPDVIAKGGDYRPETVVGATEARAWGGEVVILPFVEGHSSSALVERIRATGSRT